jgi:hypothetical protein
LSSLSHHILSIVAAQERVDEIIRAGKINEKKEERAEEVGKPRNGFCLLLYRSPVAAMPDRLWQRRRPVVIGSGDDGGHT